MEEEHHFNNWDLGAVMRTSNLLHLSSPRQADIPAALLHPQTQTQKKTVMPTPTQEPAKKTDANVGWRFPDLCAGTRQDDDELLRDLLATYPPLPLPSPRPPPPQPQQQQQLVVTAADVPPPHVCAALASAPARVQTIVCPELGGLSNPNRRYAFLKGFSLVHMKVVVFLYSFSFTT